MFHAKPRKLFGMLLYAATVLLMLSTAALKGTVANRTVCDSSLATAVVR